jgi:hypothetical protein
VTANGAGSWSLGLVGQKSEQFRKVTLTDEQLTGLTVRDITPTYAGDAGLLRLGIQAYALGIAFGRIQRLAVFMPPGSGKSTYASILFPPWLMATMPKVEILAVLPTTQLASQWGRHVRKLVSDQRLVLGVSLATDSGGGDCWKLEQGGSYPAVGVIIGTAYWPVDLAIIDDPIAASEGAYSPLVRDRLWDWYNMCTIISALNSSTLASSRTGVLRLLAVVVMLRHRSHLRG